MIKIELTTPELKEKLGKVLKEKLDYPKLEKFILENKLINEKNLRYFFEKNQKEVVEKRDPSNTFEILGQTTTYENEFISIDITEENIFNEEKDDIIDSEITEVLVKVKKMR